MADRPLTGKQKKFIDAYLDDDRANFNATEAARLAGYRGDDNILAVVGHENLRKLKIKETISLRLKASAMGADETLKHIGDIARDKADKTRLKALELIAKHHGQLDSTLHIKIKDELDVIFNLLEEHLDEETFSKIVNVLSASS